MSTKTKINYCDATGNPWQGCSGGESVGCKNCHMKARLRRFGPAPNKLTPVKGFRKSMLALNRRMICSKCGKEDFYDAACAHCGSTLWRYPLVLNSSCDWLDAAATPAMLAEYLDVIRLTPNVRYLLLTKQPQRWREALEWVGEREFYDHTDTLKEASIFAANWICRMPPANVLPGVSVSTQAEADRLIPAGLAIPSAHGLVVSVEPMLGSVNLLLGHDFKKHDVLRGILKLWNSDGQLSQQTTGKVSWLILGCESVGARVGRLATYCESGRLSQATKQELWLDWTEWAIALVRQCRAAGVKVWVKQIPVWRDGKLVMSHEPTDEWPQELKVRERI